MGETARWKALVVVANFTGVTAVAGWSGFWEKEDNGEIGLDRLDLGLTVLPLGELSSCWLNAFLGWSDSILLDWNGTFGCQRIIGLGTSSRVHGCLRQVNGSSAGIQATL